MWKDKLSSGRYFLTVVAGLVFAYCSIRHIIQPDKVYDIISIVVVAYFMKGQNDKTKGA